MKYNNIKKQPYFIATDKECPTQIWTASTTKSKTKKTIQYPQKKNQEKKQYKSKKNDFKKAQLTTQNKITYSTRN